MKRGHIIPAALAATVLGLALALGLTLTASASAAPSRGTAAAAAAAKPGVVVVNCLGRSQLDPRSFVLACADGNSALSAMSWTSWTPKLASATGTLVQNDCIPYCAAGHFHNYPVLIVLWDPVRYGGEHRYADLTMIFTGARPLIYNGHKWVPVSQTLTETLWAPEQ